MKKITKTRWGKKELALFGTMPDRDIAKRLGRSVRCVARQRQRLGIAPVRSPRGFDPTKKHLLGKMRDEKLAEKLGCALITIHRWRARFKISCHRSKNRPWTKTELAFLGKFPDRELAKLFNRDLQKLKNRRLREERQRSAPSECLFVV